MDYRVNGPRPRPPEGQFMGDLCRAAVVVVIGIPLTTLSSLSPTFPPFLCVVLLTSATLFTSLGVEFEEGARHLKILNLLRGRLINGQHSLSDRYTYDVLQEIANHLLARTQLRPKIGIILGTGLGSLANQLTDADYIDYQTIPHFPVSTVEGHVGRLIFGYLKGVPVMCMQGRFHYYEGYPLAKCAMPVRVMKLVGCSHLIATNAAGGLHPDYKVGDIMLMKDHINIMGFAGNNPLQGPNDSRFGPRFPNMFNAYDFKLLKKAKEIGRDIGIENNLHEGVYICLGGPNFETVAELKMLRIWGVDAVGMSTVHEITTAVHCGMTCFAFSLITNLCIPSYDLEESPCHEDIVGIGKRQENTLTELVSRMAKHIHMELKK